MTDEPSPPMKPQETVIYILGQLQGSMIALQTSVDNNNQAQAAINQKNESDHEKFQTTDADLDKRVAVLEDNRLSQRYTKSELTQKYMTWIGVPAAIASVIALGTMILNK
jgi:hypothetical protein